MQGTVGKFPLQIHNLQIFNLKNGNLHFMRRKYQ